MKTRRSLLLAILLALAAGCGAKAGRPVSPFQCATTRSGAERSPIEASPAERSSSERIRYYSTRIAESPRLYPMHTQLGLALLERARETHDPLFLARAREAETTALSLQDNFDSVLAMAAIQNYAHRFEDALRWGKRAAAASVGGTARSNPAVVAVLVEAHLGLGQLDEAGGLVASAEDARDVRSATALGRWLAASGRADEAARAFARVGALAGGDGEPSLAAWAEAAAAGVFLDAGRPGEARRRLEAAARLDPCATPVLVHRAELEEAEGRPGDALAILEAALRRDPDPAIEARAFATARKAGDRKAAERHFAAAEEGLERAIEAGEVYTLEALARLYTEAGRNLDRALALAQENLEWKRDREALDALDAVRERLR